MERENNGPWEGQLVCYSCGEEVTLEQKHSDFGICPHCGFVGYEDARQMQTTLKVRRKVYVTGKNVRNDDPHDWRAWRRGPRTFEWEYKDQ